MSGHRVTPYELTATRKWAKEDEAGENLLLASVSDDKTVDLLDVVEAHIKNVPPATNADKTWELECVEVQRQKDSLSMAFAVDVSGEKETILDGSKPGRPFAFEKNQKHVSRFYSCCLLWRPPKSTEGRLLVHSPWGRGGSRVQTTRLLQRALNEEPELKVKLHAAPLVPAKLLQKFLERAKATQITYVKPKGIASTFGDATNNRTTLAHMAVVVKGSDTIPFRDALQAALKASKNRDALFSIRLRDEGAKGGYIDETFEDVLIDLDTGGGIKRYSMRTDAIPTVTFDETSEINNLYFALPENNHDIWAKELLKGATPVLEKLLLDVPVVT